MDDELKIVRAEPVEWKKYRALRLEALQAEPQAFGSSYERDSNQPDEKWQERIREALHPDSNLLLFAKEGEQFVGMIGAFFSDAPKQKHIATIYGVYLNANYRGRGIGKKLMEAVLREIGTRPQIIKLELSVNAEQSAAVRLYQHFGFRIVGRAEKELNVNGKFYDEYFMEKMLQS